MTGKVCVVLGAGKGLGMSLAKKFSENGYKGKVLTGRKRFMQFYPIYNMINVMRIF